VDRIGSNDLSLKDWIKHALEECLDQAVYLERLGRDVEMMVESPASTLTRHHP